MGFLRDVEYCAVGEPTGQSGIILLVTGPFLIAALPMIVPIATATAIVDSLFISIRFALHCIQELSGICMGCEH